MKKIYFAIAACAMFAFTACNNSTSTTGDDTTKPADTVAPAPAPAPAADTMKKDTAAAPKADAKASDKK
jgi:hypothetical protein